MTKRGWYIVIGVAVVLVLSVLLNMQAFTHGGPTPVWTP